VPRSVDVRFLPPPEPLEKILASLDELPCGEELHVRIHREPMLLYPILERRGFSRDVRALEDGTFEIVIGRAR
jgi:uncharacterized protein (DUF2249 family)